MTFIFTGFTQDQNFRQFAFEGIAEDRTRIALTVRADLQLVRKYRIAVQELPLLCRVFLENHPQADPNHILTFGEPEMVDYASRRTAAVNDAVKRRKPPTRPPGANIGRAWRGPALGAHTS